MGLFSWLAVPRRQNVDKLVGVIRDYVSNYKLLTRDVCLLLEPELAGRYSPDQLEAAIDRIRRGEVPPDPEVFRALVRGLTDVLGVTLPTYFLEPRISVAFRKLRATWGVALLTLTSYIVFGGLLSGQSALLSEPGMAFAVFCVLMTALAAFEGLQMSVGFLRFQNLSVEQGLPARVIKLHRLFRTEIGARRFLAGRQLVVVVVVFFLARLTSFPDMRTWPGTTWAFPDWMSPWFHYFFLRLGLLGAFLLLWVGQLAPQFLANLNPVGFLSTVGMGLALRLSFFIEAVGLTLPGDWLARFLGKEGPPLPVSPMERYGMEVARAGYGSMGITKIYRVDTENVVLTYTNRVRFERPGFRTLTERSLLVRGAAKEFTVRHDLVSSTPGRNVNAEPVTEVDIGSGWCELTQQVSPSYGGFKPGETVVSEASIQWASGPDFVDPGRVASPTRFILFRVEAVAGLPLSTATVRAYTGGEVDAPVVVLKDRNLDVVQSNDGSLVAEFLDSWPETGTSYELSWSTQ